MGLEQAIERNRARQRELFDKGYADGKCMAEQGFGFVSHAEPPAYLKGVRAALSEHWEKDPSNHSEE